jgi:hypothetical protein
VPWSRVHKHSKELVLVVRHTRLVLPAKAQALPVAQLPCEANSLYGVLDGDHLLGQELFDLHTQAGCDA